MPSNVLVEDMIRMELMQLRQVNSWWSVQRVRILKKICPRIGKKWGS